MSNSNEQKNNKLFDPEIAFFDLPIVRNTFGIACLLVVVSFGTIALFTESKASLDMVGFNGFIEMFKFPLGSIAFFGGLFAFYATNHRSEQQRRAMELAQKSMDLTGAQNIFANHFKMIDEFEKYAEGIKENNLVKIESLDKRGFYSIFYRESRSGAYKPSAAMIKPITSHLNSIFRRVLYLHNNNSASMQRILMETKRIPKYINSVSRGSIRLDTTGLYSSEMDSLETIMTTNPYEISEEISKRLITAMSMINVIEDLLRFDEQSVELEELNEAVIDLYEVASTFGMYRTIGEDEYVLEDYILRDYEPLNAINAKLLKSVRERILQ